jgi:hypothetical protein
MCIKQRNRILEKLIVSQLKKKCNPFMEPELSLPSAGKRNELSLSKFLINFVGIDT